MSGSGGGNTFTNGYNWLVQGTKQIGNYYGFNDAGKWDPGGSKQGVFGALNQVDGTTAARDALSQSETNFNTAQAQAAAVVAQNNWVKQGQDLQASGAAGAAAATARSTSGFNYASATPLAMGPGAATTANKDYLGL